MKKHSQHLLWATLCLALAFSSCMKHNDPSAGNSLAGANKDQMVVTPAGLLPKSQVHHIGSGYQLSRENGHMFKRGIGSASARTDLGTVRPPVTQNQPKPKPGTIPFDANPGWVTFASWQNTSSSAISNLTCNWTVPSLPASNDDQTLFIFNGLQVTAATDILQPVLQYGSSAAGDVSGWGIANWYVWLDDNGLTQAGYSDLIAVSPGVSLQAVVSLAGQDGDGSYHYVSSFTGYSNSLDINEGDVYSSGSIASAVAQQTETVITLETYHAGTYGVAQASDYPAGQNFIDINNITVSLNGSLTGSSWVVDNNNTPFQESTQVISDNTVLFGFPLGTTRSVPGDIRIYFHAVPQIDGQNLNVGFTPSSPAAVTITGYPGGLVNVLMDATATATSSTTSTFTISTPGVTFPDGTTSFSVSRSNSTGTSQGLKAFYMPAGGSITANCTVVSNNPTGGLGLRIPPGEVGVY